MQKPVLFSYFLPVFIKNHINFGISFNRQNNLLKVDENKLYKNIFYCRFGLILKYVNNFNRILNFVSARYSE